MLMLIIIAPLVFLWTGVLPLVNITTEAVVYYQLPMILAIAGGIWAFAPRQYFPFAAQVHGTFQSYEISANGASSCYRRRVISGVLSLRARRSNPGTARTRRPGSLRCCAPHNDARITNL